MATATLVERRTRMRTRAAGDKIAHLIVLIFGAIVLLMASLLVFELWWQSTVMTFPFIISVSRESLLAVPRERREAALSLGATKWESTSQLVAP